MTREKLCNKAEMRKDMKLDFKREQITGVIDKVVNKTMTMDLVWEWPCGVAYYGVCEAYEATKEKRYLDMLVTWTDEYIKMGLPAWNVNTCAMGHCMLTLYKETKDKKYLDIIKEKLAYLKNDALRFGDGVLQHTVSSSNDFPEQAWADTLFMAAFFMLRAGKMLDDEELIKDALKQYYWHINYLQDKTTSLWYHGYNNIGKDHMSGFYWGRANGWAAYTMSQIKKVLDNWYLYPECMEAECSLRDQLAAVKLLQSENGLYHTILDDKSVYEEVSATCAIAAAMIDNGNPLHAKYVQKSLDGILKNITEDGRVMNVSGGTAIMRDRDGYANIPKNWIQGWGQGLALAFLCAVLTCEN